MPDSLAAHSAAWESPRTDRRARRPRRDDWWVRSPSATRCVPLRAPPCGEIKALGLHCVLVTGDHEAAARTVASSIGVDDVIAAALPADKVAAIRHLQQEGHRVAMVGDGINDGPALACANLGLAVGSGTDVAMESADLIIMRDNLMAVPMAITLARRTYLTIRTNLLWAFGYNVDRHSPCCVRVPQPADRRCRHGPLFWLCRVEQRALASLLDRCRAERFSRARNMRASSEQRHPWDENTLGFTPVRRLNTGRLP